MSAISIQQMADRVAGLMEEKLRVRGTGLPEKLRKGGSLLPRALRPEAELLAQASVISQNPKLMRQIDMEKVSAAYDLCVRHLGGIDTAGRRKGAVIGVAASIAFSLLTVAVLLAAVLHWRGYL